MKKSAIQIDTGYFGRYIQLAGDGELVEELEGSLQTLTGLDTEHLKRVGEQVYAPGKWTVRDIIQHVTDTERIFQYRALRFARKDPAPLPGFEQDDYARWAGAGERELSELLEELKTVRLSTIFLFRGFSDDALQRRGTAGGNLLSVLATGFVITGHQEHHLRIIREKYLPLAAG